MAIPAWRLPLAAPPRALAIGLGFGAGPESPSRTYYRLGFWSVHLYRWRGSVTIDGTTVPVLPGHAGICPIADILEYRYQTEERHLYAHFQPQAGAEPVPMPALIDCGEQFERLYDLLHSAIGWSQSAPAHASARLWDVLWQLYRLPAAARAGGHPAVAAARHLIEVKLAQPLAIADLADAVDCSHNHLIRLFRDELGTTIVGYIRQRRMEHAKLLLEHSSLPIAAVAAEVGVPDVAQFSKQVRRTWGKPPREVRQAAAPGYPTVRSR
jgi:AraC family transcriptional regulator